MGLKEKYVVLEIKRYFDPVKVMNNLWKINLLIMVISDGKEYIYSEGSATPRL